MLATSRTQRRLNVDVAELFDESRLGQRAEEARTLQIVGDDTGNIGTDRTLLISRPEEIDDGDGQRVDMALGDIDLQRRAR